MRSGVLIVVGWLIIWGGDSSAQTDAPGPSPVVGIVQLDIEPDWCPDQVPSDSDGSGVVLRSSGVTIPAALTGSADLDVHLIDPMSIRIGIDVSRGEPFVDINRNGVYDGPDILPGFPDGEPFTDLSGDGTYQYPYDLWAPGIPFRDFNNNGFYDTGASPVDWSLVDVAGEGTTDCDCNTDGPDGVVDLVFLFDWKATLLTQRASYPEDLFIVRLRGETYDGQAFLASDCWVMPEMHCHADPYCDALTNVLDVVAAIGVAFRSVDAEYDTVCGVALTDIDCSGSTNVLDVVRIINVAFRGMDASHEFTDECDQW